MATATEIYDYLRLLYARCGTVTCLHCGGVVKRDTVDEIVASLLALEEGTRVYALFPIVRAEVKLEPLAGSDSAFVPEVHQSRGEEGRGQQDRRRRRASGEHRGDCNADGCVEGTAAGASAARASTACTTDAAAAGIVEFSTPESLLELNFTVGGARSLCWRTGWHCRRRHSERG